MEAAADTTDRRQAARAARWRVVNIADALEVMSATVLARLQLIDEYAPAGLTVPVHWRPRAVEPVHIGYRKRPQDNSADQRNQRMSTMDSGLPTVSFTAHFPALSRR